MKYKADQQAFLKWAGGKRKLLPKIIPHLPQSTHHKCLIEPFVGAGSIFLNTKYQHYVLFDINRDLINLFKIIQNRLEEFIALSGEYFQEHCNHKEFYYSQRQVFNQSNDEMERAVLFLYLNRTGYNGLCRYNLKQEFNVPFGRYKKIYFPETQLRFFSQRAKNAEFVHGDFTEAFAVADKNCVIYCDPPYAPLDVQKSNFTNYAGNKFDQEQQCKLAKLAEDAKIPVLISNHDTPFTRNLYRQAQKIHSFSARRNISQKASQRGLVKELLAIFN